MEWAAIRSSPARVASASGEVVDAKDDKELLWALRGAGNGNFGAVVELTIKVYRRPAMLGGYLGFSLADGQKYIRQIPENYHRRFSR